ncbi:alpha/beta hydrolase fold protein [Oleiphilus messinensis]|uniref:Alpha/beta hydrolase fold protein n=1 Tax=Oleiphilus messinensis TaxID=141451 RepID=A0A1Y0IDC8_9GAMM|nr:alpha/beta hydrolase [Oleiphilus messinensis]ARU57485.1 alpha/beta hydrolase fold protein [Oleiphilus messinensis]
MKLDSTFVKDLLPWSYEYDGVTLRGWHTPVTGKPVIHFIHGNGFCGLVYEPMLARLQSEFDIFISDVQGHGDSDGGDTFWGWNGNARVCAAIWREKLSPWQGVAKIALGHSFGGVLSALLVSEFPELFDMAILLDPVLFSRSMIGAVTVSEWLGLGPINQLSKQTLKRRSQWSSREQAFQSLHNRGTYKGWSERALQAFVQYAISQDEEGGLASLKCKPEREAEIFATVPDRLWSMLAKIDTPTQILYGEDSFPFVAKSAGRLHRNQAWIAARKVSGGHCFMQQYPEQTVKTIKQLILRQLQ